MLMRYVAPLTVVLCGAWHEIGQAQGVITVKREEPTVTRIEFDRRRPPPDMPDTGIDGSGVCNNIFEIEAGIGSSIEVLSPTTVRAYPEDFEIITRLKTTIYTAKGSPAKLVAHEEGHRTIGIHYYQESEAAARAAAMSLVGKSFEGSGPTRAAAEEAAGALVLAALVDAYTVHTQKRSIAANARYDAITDHGLKPIAEPDAIAQAIAEDP